MLSSDTFEIADRGLVLVPGFPVDTVHHGDELLLRRPDGTIITVNIAGLELLTRSAVTPISIRGVSKSDVPIGTEVVHSSK